jgi:hypothetical protein
MSPKEFFALHRAYRERMEHFDWHMASLKAFYVQFHGGKTTAEEFMGKKSAKKQLTYPTNEQLERQLTTIFGVGPKKKA